MNFHRRSFLQKTAAFGLGAMFTSIPSWSKNLETALKAAEGIPAGDLAGGVVGLEDGAVETRHQGRVGVGEEALREALLGAATAARKRRDRP